MISFPPSYTLHIGLLVLLSFLYLSNGKTVVGTFNSYIAKANSGQYVTSFAFHGESLLKYSLNSTGSGAKLLLFLSEDWKDAVNDPDCDRRLAKARTIVPLNESVGQRHVSLFVYPRIWHLVFADFLTCDPEGTEKLSAQANYVSYTIHLLNPDSLGNPTEHFGDQETGLLKFHQLQCVIYFVVACMVAPQLAQTLTKGGPMQLVIQLLGISLSLQSMGAFIIMIHFYRYSVDGVGSPLFEVISEFFDMLSQFTVLFMLLCLSLGWNLASAHSLTHLTHIRTISEKPSVRFVFCLGLLQGLLFMWEQTGDQSYRLYHAQRSYAGISLFLVRLLLAAMFAVKLKNVIRSERSKLKRQFYNSFNKLCLLWFLCYPVMVLVSWLFAEYLRYKLITMGVLVGQSIAGVLLYRLFLSRSLYWEVSALSSTLPLRFDHRYGLKIYS